MFYPKTYEKCRSLNFVHEGADKDIPVSVSYTHLTGIFSTNLKNFSVYSYTLSSLIVVQYILAV